MALGDDSAMGFIVSEVEPTPNPNAAKFVLDRPISDQPISFFNAAAAEGHPLAKKLFAIEGVASLLLLGDFITVNKSPKAQWKEVTKSVKQVLAAEE
jgi:NFU1 iron-sulfur cluster scaffold homolog, mitochondrial